MKDPQQQRLDAYRKQIRRTCQAMSDQALMYQNSVTRGGIDREEVDREIARRRADRNNYNW